MADTTKDWLFSALIMIMVLALIAFGFIAVLRDIDLTRAAIIITFLTSSCTFLLGYRWGSSKGSKEKTGMMAKEMEEDKK